MAFRLPRLPTTYTQEQLQRWWQTVCEAIEAQEASQDSTLSQITASMVLGGAGQVTADAAGAVAKSGQATTGGLTVDSASWVAGPTVALTGVTGGMPSLTLTGSAPISATLSGGPMDGEYRIVEVAGSLTVFTGRFTLKTTSAGAPIITLPDPVNTQVFTRSATGSVSYRMDIRKVAGAGVALGLTAYLFARRAA